MLYTMIDYKQLLIRYIEHIKCIEGIDYIYNGTPSGYDIKLTTEEFAELSSLSGQYKEETKWKDAINYQDETSIDKVDFSDTYKKIELKTF